MPEQVVGVGADVVSAVVDSVLLGDDDRSIDVAARCPGCGGKTRAFARQRVARVLNPKRVLTYEIRVTCRECKGSFATGKTFEVMER
jgi:uncharacterized protein with PIN domain